MGKLRPQRPWPAGYAPFENGPPGPGESLPKASPPWPVAASIFSSLAPPPPPPPSAERGQRPGSDPLAVMLASHGQTHRFCKGNQESGF